MRVRALLLLGEMGRRRCGGQAQPSQTMCTVDDAAGNWDGGHEVRCSAPGFSGWPGHHASTTLRHLCSRRSAAAPRVFPQPCGAERMVVLTRWS